jgi:hypothetical protein
MTRHPQSPTGGRRERGRKGRGANGAAGRGAEPVSKSKTLTGRLKPKQTPEAAAAEILVEGLGTNAATAASYSKMLGEPDLTECMAALIEGSRKVQNGNLASVEAILAAQAVTLNAMFTQLAYQASKMTIVDQLDRFIRLALKAQGQCRATIETLALIKNPPTVFARQANIAHGPQQVNNSVVLAGAGHFESEPTKLLEANGERLDIGATSAAGTRDQAMAAVGPVNRSANR